MNSPDLLELLRDRHRKDVFVSECKTGSTMFGAHRRMDAWVMRRSYANEAFIAYEIKSSRSDFLKDDKWRDYLLYCSEFYFVCPSKMIDPKELPDEAGLLWASSTGTRLYCKKKAPARAVSIPTELFMYVLMTRTKITREQYEPEDPLDYWREWLARKTEGGELGRRISRKVKKHVARMESEVYRMKQEVGEYKEIKALLDELGVSPHSWRKERAIREAFNGSDNAALIKRLHGIEGHVKEAIAEAGG